MEMNTKSGCVWAVVIAVYLFLVMISVFPDFVNAPPKLKMVF